MRKSVPMVSWMMTAVKTTKRARPAAPSVMRRLPEHHVDIGDVGEVSRGRQGDRHLAGPGHDEKEVTRRRDALWELRGVLPVGGHELALVDRGSRVDELSGEGDARALAGHGGEGAGGPYVTPTLVWPSVTSRMTDDDLSASTTWPTRPP